VWPFLTRDATLSAVIRLHVAYPAVCLSVTIRYRDHIGWNTLKIISPPNSLRSLLTLTLTLAIWLADNSLQSADKDQQEMRAVAEKPHVAIPNCTEASRGHPFDSVASCCHVAVWWILEQCG